MIYFNKTVLNVSDVASEFASNIRPVTLQINLSNTVPTSFLRELPPILDHEIAKGFSGFPFNREDLKIILAGKHPDLPELVGISQFSATGQRLIFAGPLTSEQETAVREFFDQWETGWPIQFEVGTKLAQDSAAPRVSIPGDILRFRPAKQRVIPPAFVQEDEAFWFDHVDQIFEDGLAPRFIFDYDDVGVACYLDASSFSQIDLRQALLCYDTVLMSPPLSDGDGTFWQSQTVSRDDLLALIEANRLELVLRQPEERTDPSFLAEAYKTNSRAVIGRRRAAALVAADLVQTADEFRFNQADALPHIPALAQAPAPLLGASEAEIIHLLTWPSGARRGCLLPLMSTGLMSLGSFGPGRLLGEQLQRVTGRDLQLEALVAADGVYVAHTLNATFIPPTNDIGGWLEPRRVIGDRLNFYRSFNTRIAAAWAISERQREERRKLLPPIPLFEFDPHAKIDDVLRLTAFGSDRRKGRALIGRLSDLPADERQAELDRLSSELYQRGLRKDRRRLMFDTFDNVKEVGLALAGFSVFPIRSAWGLVKVMMDVGRRIPAIDGFMDILQHDLSRSANEDIDFLAKI